MDSKTVWPTEQRLQRLREAGKVPLSSFACRAGATLCFLLALWGSRQKVLDMQQAFSVLLGSDSPLSFSNQWLDFCSAFLGALLIPLMAGLVGALLLGLLQTKFLFRLDLIAFQGARLGRGHLPRIAAWCARPLVSLAQAALMLTLGYLVVRIAWTGMFYLLNHDRVYAQGWALGVAQFALVPVCAVLGIAALVSWAVGKFYFLYRHRMTRQEADSDAVEVKVTL